MQRHDVTRKILGGQAKFGGSAPPGTPLASPLVPSPTVTKENKKVLG